MFVADLTEDVVEIYQPEDFAATEVERQGGQDINGDGIADDLEAIRKDSSINLTF